MDALLKKLNNELDYYKAEWLKAFEDQDQLKMAKYVNLQAHVYLMIDYVNNKLNNVIIK